MVIDSIQLERLRFISSCSFDEVIAGMEGGIGRPNMPVLGRALLEADSYASFAALVRGAVGTSDLMEFLRIDLGVALRIDPRIQPYRIMRIIAGNPLIMKEMTRYVPDAGSYAPVTILVYEQPDGVHICYDSMESLLSIYRSNEATEVAKALDKKVIQLLASL